MKKKNDLERTWLIQRLSKPVKTDTIFNFGGGLRNGGINDEAYKLISKIFTFDYMGAAEFEWGAVPKSLQHIVDHRKDYIGRKLLVGCVLVYIINDSNFNKQIDELISKLAHGKISLKEPSYLNCLVGNSEFKSRDNLIGGIELNNHFVYFTDVTAFNNTCALFDIKSSI